jgi:hypothetical protein
MAKMTHEAKSVGCFFGGLEASPVALKPFKEA